MAVLDRAKAENVRAATSFFLRFVREDDELIELVELEAAEADMNAKEAQDFYAADTWLQRAKHKMQRRYGAQ